MVAAPEASEFDAVLNSDFDVVLKQFRNFDSDGSGTLGKPELTAVLQRLQPGQWSEDKVSRLFKLIDRNEDDLIQFEEFLSWVFANAGENGRGAFKEELDLEIDQMCDMTSMASAMSSPSAPPFVMTRKSSMRTRKLKQFYDIGEVIGEGEFATVYRARDRSTGTAIAIKSITKDELSTMKKQQLAARFSLTGKEIEIESGATQHLGSLTYPDKQVALVNARCDLAGRGWHGTSARIRAQLRRDDEILHAASILDLTFKQDFGEDSATASEEATFPTRDAMVFRGRPGDVYDFEISVQTGGEAAEDGAKEARTFVLDFQFRLHYNGQATEAVFFQMLDHPNIVKVHDFFEDFRQLHFCMELCEGGELFDAIIEVGRFDERGAAAIARQVVSAVHNLHSNKIMHRDLKLENLMLRWPRTVSIERNTVKIIDLGSARGFPPEGSLCTTKVGSPYYQAPQVLTAQYDQACDTWSLGVVCYVLLCGRPPFDGETEFGVWEKIKIGKFDFDGREWEMVSQDAKDFISRCLTLDASARISTAEALEHGWLMELERMPRRSSRRLSMQMLQNIRGFWESNQLKKAALCEIGKRADLTKLEELREIFEALDVDRTGELSISELQMGLEAADMGVGTGSLGWRTWLEQTFGEELDTITGSERRINYSTFLGSMVNRRALEEENACWQAFCAFDRDGSGQISLKELREVLQDSCVRDAIDTETIKTILDEADLNGDGQIDFWEFVEAIRAQPRYGGGGAKFSFTADLGPIDKHDLKVKRSPLSYQRLCVEHVRLGGAVEKWNKKQATTSMPEAEVRPGDEIVKVNNVLGDPDLMMQELDKCQQGLKLSLVRWQRRWFERRASLLPQADG